MTPVTPTWVSFEQYVKEVKTFRDIMTDGKNTIAHIDHALGCLFVITNRTNPNDPKREQIDSWWYASSQEWIRRKELMVLRGHPLGEAA